MTTREILIVEDDDDIRESVLEILTDAGYLATGARHGEDALAQLRGARTLPGLILLDLMMPVMDGHEFRARQVLDPALREVPVVVLTADIRFTDSAVALQAAAALRKPVSLVDLLAVVERFCGPSSQPDRS
jgi:CheY-like chemotaxis protein